MTNAHATPASPAASPTSKARRTKLSRWIAAAVALLVGGTLAHGAATYNVAATEPHARPVETLLAAGMEYSVRTHAADVQIPPGVDLRDPTLAELAIGHYSVACATCHGAPGEGPAPWMVLYPPPSNLTDPAVVGRWSDQELYWIIKNGIKDTGMIALGPTHQERDLWAVAAFVRQLPTMSRQRYDALRAKAGAAMPSAEPHSHH